MDTELLKKEKELLEQVCRQIEVAGHQFDLILGIATGGLLPTRIVANRLNVRHVDVISVRSYDKDNQKKDLELLVDKDMEHLRGQNILVVDDLVDNGETMDYVVGVIKKYQPNLVKTAVIYKKDGSTFHPDFYGLKTPKSEWITFSWEM